MKTIHLAFTCFILFLLSCNSDSKTVAATDTAATGSEKTTSMAQKNLDAMHVVDKAFQTGDVSGIDSVVAANFVDHTDKGEMNRDSLKAMIKMSAANKTMKMETTKEVADDDYAFGMMHMTRTGDGVMMPAGPYDMHSVEVVKFVNGKAVEHWSYMQGAEMMKMMQKMMPPGSDKMKMDAGKKKK
jgi:predicted SnoaL-like aldol condensation-catalyzing enzyme